VLLLLIFSLLELQAQKTIPTAGGNASGSGGTASFTVGQAVYTTNSGATGSVAQGVQQPFEISILTSVDETNSISLQFAAYPNPATDYLILRIDGELKTEFSVSLYDVNGRLLLNKKIEGNETKILMSKLMRATYFLKVEQKKDALTQQEVKTFKVIKN
jgi:hypothetical protein